MTVSIHHFFHQQSATLCYLVVCKASNHAMLIDAPADFDLPSGELSFATAKQIIDFIAHHKLTLEWIVETHAHADHISAASYIKQQLKQYHPCKLGTGERICEVQKHFSELYQLDFVPNGAPFDYLFAHQTQFALGELTIDVIATPGHTPDSVCYHVAGNAFVGDTFFMPDSGTARCDFPGGSAEELYQSLQRILALPDDTQLWMCHDYQPNGRDLAFVSTVAQQRLTNVHLQQGKQAFIKTRENRDKQLAVPKLLHPAIQLNIRAGMIPNNMQFLSIPLSVLP